MPFLNVERVTFDPEKKMTHAALEAMIGQPHKASSLGTSGNGVVHSIRSYATDGSGNIVSAELFIQV